jgi:GDP-mannose 6-dehydrogenase
MKICVLGLGYVGTVSAACLAEEGHEVIGVDPQRPKVERINAGKSPVVERGLDEVLAREVAAGRLAATGDAAAAVRATDLALVCVGTPSLPNGDNDLAHLRRVCAQIGAALRDHPGAPVIAVRSTVLPGTMRQVVIPALEAGSGKRAGVEFGVCLNPEFLREGSALRDFRDPPKTVIGEINPASGDLLARLYAHKPGPLLRTDLDSAEMIKYADNAWHALKVGFANEIGNLCKALGLDGHRVMDMFCQDTKLNLSARYLKPGFAFGGSCLPKDLRALLHKARALDLEAPILGAILPSNQQQIERALRAVIAEGRRKVGILGFSFKAGTDDLRESPVLELAERLLGKGYELRMYDANVSLARIHGTNREFLLERIPHIARLMVATLDEVLAHAGTLVIGNAAPEFRDVPQRLAEGQSIVDLARITDACSVSGVYEGICW